VNTYKYLFNDYLKKEKADEEVNPGMAGTFDNISFFVNCSDESFRCGEHMEKCY